jgi:hypothetical protein
MKASCAAYCAERRATLRSLERQRVLANALEMARENQRTKGKHYTRAMLKILKGRAA